MPAGVILLLFGTVSYALTLRFDLWTALHVVLGAALTSSGILLDFRGFRRSVASRGTRERVRALTGTFLFGGILVGGNLLVARHPWRYDATENKIHTLTPKTEALLSGLQDPVEILAFLEPGDPARKDLELLLGRYAARSAQLTWKLVDAEREPQLADQLGVRRQGTVVARARGNTAQAEPDAGGIGEGTVSNLILKVTRPGPKTLYFLTGHGEPGLDDASEAEGLGRLAKALEGETFVARPLLLAGSASVPDDAVALLAVGPRKPLFPQEAAQISAYLERGGRVLFLLDPGVDAGVAGVLADYRITLGDDMIVDQQEVPLFGARLGLNPIVGDFLPHPVTRRFQERIVLLQARSVDVATEGGITGVEAHAIAETGRESWAEHAYREMERTGSVAQDPEDAPGPIAVAAASSIEATEGNDGAGSRLVVVGDSDFAINANLDAFFNREFLLRVVEWLAGRDDLVAEGPHGLRPSRLEMTESDFRTLFRLGVLLLPEVLLIFGIAVWRRRRSL